MKCLWRLIYRDWKGQTCLVVYSSMWIVLPDFFCFMSMYIYIYLFIYLNIHMYNWFKFMYIYLHWFTLIHMNLHLSIYIYTYIIFMYLIWLLIHSPNTAAATTSSTTSTTGTSSTAQGGGGSFKNRKPIGEVGCCESRMAERSHWLTERWLELCLLEWLQWLQWSPHPQLLDVVWCTATVVVVVA